MQQPLQQGGARAGHRDHGARRGNRGDGRGEGEPEEPAQGDGAGAGADQTAAGGGGVQNPGTATLQIQGDGTAEGLLPAAEQTVPDISFSPGWSFGTSLIV